MTPLICKAHDCPNPEAKLYARNRCRFCYLRVRTEHRDRKKLQDLRVAVLVGDKERATQVVKPTLASLLRIQEHMQGIAREARNDVR